MSAIRMVDDVGAEAGEERTRSQPERDPRRLFADDQGVLWTAELRRPRVTGEGPGAPLILFWSDTRACMATLRNSRPIAELTEDELRRHLRACLTG